MLISAAPAATPLERLHQALGRAFATTLQHAGDLLMVKELEGGRWVHVNAAMAEFLRATPNDLIGCVDAEVFDSAMTSALRAAEHTARSQSDPLRSDHTFEWRGLRCEFSVLRVVMPAEGHAQGLLVSVWRDETPENKRQAQLQLALAQIEQQQKANDALRREIADQALRDPTSGLYRRAHFDDQLRRELDLCNREHREFAVVFIEMDPHSPRVLAQGDEGRQQVLQALGQLLRGGTRAMDASCRYDDHRFAVLLSGVGLATAHARMEGLRRKCAAQIVVHAGLELGFTVAIGVASFPHTASNQAALLAACEAALLEAQRRGGNQVTLAAICFATAPTQGEQPG